MTRPSLSYRMISGLSLGRKLLSHLIHHWLFIKDEVHALMTDGSFSPTLEPRSLFQQSRQLRANKTMLRLAKGQETDQERPSLNLQSLDMELISANLKIYGILTSASVSLSLPPKNGPLPSVEASRGSISFTAAVTNCSATASRSDSEAARTLANKCGTSLLKNASTKNDS